jgi:MHS family proline/betaine transporter-like MFS transporter
MEPPRHQTKTVVAGVIGNVLEWYDFAVFGFLASYIGPQFFPAENELAELLNTFGVFALGFLMRPVGGVVFGHIGDRLGRKQALLWSVALMAVPTTLIAFLPTYEQIGLAAPVLLTLIRMLQGMSVGGEFIGSMSFLGEHAPPERRGFVSSWCTFSGGLGNLLGSGAAALAAQCFSDADMRSWGWRVPFLGGLAVGVVGLWLRRGIAESPTFEAARRHGDTAKLPLVVALRENLDGMLLTVGISLMLGVGFYLPWVWLPTWLAEINQPPMKLGDALTVNTYAMSLMIALTPVAGWLSDKLGRKAVLAAGSAALVVLSYPLFRLLSGGTMAHALQAQLVIAVCAALASGPASAAFVELFPTRTRYSGIAFAYNASQALLGGTTPLVATFLIQRTGDTTAPAFYLMVAAAGTFAAAMGMRDRTGEPLR